MSKISDRFGMSIGAGIGLGASVILYAESFYIGLGVGAFGAMLLIAIHGITTAIEGQKK